MAYFSGMKYDHPSCVGITSKTHETRIPTKQPGFKGK